MERKYDARIDYEEEVRRIERNELDKLVEELRGVMTQKEITPLDAKNAAAMLVTDINESIARHNEQYITNGKFT